MCKEGACTCLGVCERFHVLRRKVSCNQIPVEAVHEMVSTLQGVIQGQWRVLKCGQLARRWRSLAPPASLPVSVLQWRLPLPTVTEVVRELNLCDQSLRMQHVDFPSTRDLTLCGYIVLCLPDRSSTLTFVTPLTFPVVQIAALASLARICKARPRPPSAGSASLRRSHPPLFEAVW